MLNICVVLCWTVSRARKKTHFAHTDRVGRVSVWVLSFALGVCKFAKCIRVQSEVTLCQLYEEVLTSMPKWRRGGKDEGKADETHNIYYNIIHTAILCKIYFLSAICFRLIPKNPQLNALKFSCKRCSCRVALFFCKRNLTNYISVITVSHLASACGSSPLSLSVGGDVFRLKCLSVMFEWDFKRHLH